MSARLRVEWRDRIVLTTWMACTVGIWCLIITELLNRERMCAFHRSGRQGLIIIGFYRSRNRKKAQEDGEDEDDEDDDAVEEGDEEDDEEDEDEGGEGGPGPSTAEPELTRAERRELKKKQAAQKQAANKGLDEDDEDADLINPNHVEKKLNISDLGSRELTRKERYVLIASLPSGAC